MVSKKNLIEDKITKDTYRHMYESIKKTQDTSLEHGFLLCKNGEIYSNKSTECVGTTCDITIKGTCSQPIGKPRQGDFHTHPYLKKEYENYLLWNSRGSSFGFNKDGERINAPRGLTREQLGKWLSNHNSYLKYSGPSHSDLVVELERAYNGISEGTSCMAPDIDPNLLECWTANKGVVTRNDVQKALDSYEANRHKPAQKWLEDIFIFEPIKLEDRILESPTTSVVKSGNILSTKADVTEGDLVAFRQKLRDATGNKYLYNRLWKEYCELVGRYKK